MHWYLHVPFDDLVWLRGQAWAQMGTVRDYHRLYGWWTELDNIITHLDDQFERGDGIASRLGL